MNSGKAFIRDGRIFYADGPRESEVVAAKYLYHNDQNTEVEWQLELKDGFTVQWTMKLQRYGMQLLVQELQALPNERPPAPPEPEPFQHQAHLSLGLILGPDKTEIVEVNLGGKAYFPEDPNRGDKAIAIGEDAFLAGWDACLKFINERIPVPTPDPRARALAWSNYEPPEDIKELV